MSTPTALLKVLLQDLNENPDTWGSVLNISALQLLEDAIAGSASVPLISTTYTLDDSDGGPSASDSARYMIVSVTGSPGGPASVIVPTRSKVYLVNNQADDVITVKTLAGTGQDIPVGSAQWVFCDGTNVNGASAASALNADAATLAADSTLLNGVASTEYAQKGLTQTFTKGQVTQREAVTTTAGVLTVPCANSNAFYLLTTESFTVAAPTGAVDGQQFSLAIEQGSGGPHTIGFLATTFRAANSTIPVLSTVAGQVDYFAFEYCAALSAGPKWIVSQLKTLGEI